MLYDEFIQGTGCKANAHNFKVYQDLEVMYMNSDLSKEDIYKYGKKLVDNSKSADQIAFENKIKEEIAAYRKEIKRLKEDIAFWKASLENEDNSSDEWYVDWAKAQIKYAKTELKHHRFHVRELRYILE